MSSRWKKGQSGNPNGRPRGAAGLAKFIRQQTNDLQELVEIAMSIARGDTTSTITTITTRDRVAALNLLLDRALGKPDQNLAITANEAPAAEIDYTRLSLEELNELERLTEKALVPRVIDAEVKELSE